MNRNALTAEMVARTARLLFPNASRVVGDYDVVRDWLIVRIDHGDKSVEFKLDHRERQMSIAALTEWLTDAMATSDGGS